MINNMSDFKVYTDIMTNYNLWLDLWKIYITKWFNLFNEETLCQMR